MPSSSSSSSSSASDDDLPPSARTVATNIRPPSPPRRARPRSRLLSRPRKRARVHAGAAPGGQADALFAPVQHLSDTALAVRTLQSAWPGAAATHLARTPPLALRTQVRALVADAAAVEREMAAMCARNVWRRVRLPAGDFAVVATEEVGGREEGDVVRRFAGEVLEACKEEAVGMADLEAVFEDAEAAAAELVRKGWLTMRDEESFWLAVPGMGEFGRQRKGGAAELTRIVKRAPYGEMLLNKLEMRTLKKSVFTAQWHVRDLVGAGVMETVETSVGTLVRLTD